MSIAQRIDVPRNELVYSKGEDAHFIYNIVEGVAKTYQLQAEGDKCVTAFLFSHDLMGLSHRGLYVSTARALTSLSAFRIPVVRLKEILEQDARLCAGLLHKLCDKLQCFQHHVIMLSKRSASARIASFLLQIEQADVDSVAGDGEIILPMNRQDIASYAGLSVEAVSRSLHSLESEGAIMRRGPHRVCILDREKLRRLAKVC